MQCGAALAVTDIGGHREYSHDGETALLSPPKHPQALAENVLRLVKNNELRVRLARQGHFNIQQFTWNRAVNSFEAVIENELATTMGGGGTPASKRVEREILLPTVVR